MQSENNVQLKLDISEVIDHANSIENPWEKLRYLRQYTRFLAVYAEHESFQVEELIAQMPRKIRGEIWEIYSNELELEGSKSDSNTSVEQKIDINIITEFTAQTEEPKVASKQKKEEVKFQEPKKDDAVREKQKSKRTNQLHELIEKVYLTLLESNETRPSASEVWNELMTNEKKYDVDEIIQEVVKFKAIYWISKDSKEQKMKWSTFKKQLSIIRSK
jgi:hypothetical protein